MCSQWKNQNNHCLEKIIDRLSEKDVEIKIHPDTLDILSGSVKTSNVLGAALIDLKTGLMPDWQQNIKRLLDVIVASFWPDYPFTIIIICRIRVRFSSKGPIIYSQERIGYKGKPFRMYKFRSMIIDAEKEGLHFFRPTINVSLNGEKQCVNGE